MVVDIREKCRLNGIKYDTYLKRIAKGMSEQEALYGVEKKCEFCGTTFKTFVSNKKYCSDECCSKGRWIIRKQSRAHENYKEKRRVKKREKVDREAFLNRPLTSETKYIVNMWYDKGDTPEEIAAVLNRNVATIIDLLDLTTSV